MNLEEFKKYTKTITKEEFLRDSDKRDFGKYKLNCPAYVGLYSDCHGCSIKCKECWKLAIKDIKFKGEDDMENNEAKTYKTWEVIKMLSENPKLKFRINCSDAFKDEKGYIVFENTDCVDGFDGNFKGNEEWTLIQEPVDFMTAVKSGKKIKCKHEKLYGHEDLGYKYNSLANVLYYLQSYCVSEEIATILTEGKFYIQE